MDEAKYDSGWYAQADGRLRWWDGHRWTEHLRGQASPEAAGRSEGALARAAGRMLDTSFSAPADAIWSAVGRPLAGFGGGRFWLSEHYLSFERGTLKTDAQQVPVSAVISVDVRQSMTQKARGLFTVVVRVQRPSGIGFVTIEDIADGRAAQTVIMGAAHRARTAIAEHQQRQTIRYDGGWSAPASDPPAEPARGADPDGSRRDDLLATLGRLGQLRAAGVLSGLISAADGTIQPYVLLSDQSISIGQLRTPDAQG